MTIPSTSLLVVFVNTAAPGAADALRLLAAAEGFDVRPVAARDLALAVRRATLESVVRVAVAGGDGSVREAASVLAGTNIELAIIPIGTLNHRAKDLGIPLNTREAVRVCASTHTRAVNIGRVNGTVFLNTSAVGGYVTFVRNRERAERWLGYHMASAWAAVRLAARLPGFRVTLHIEGVRHTYTTPLLFIGVDERELRHPTFGARIRDGRSGLHVMVVRQRSRVQAIKLAFIAATKGVEAAAPALETFIVAECQVESRNRTIALDGQLIRMRAPLSYVIQREALRIVVP